MTWIKICGMTNLGDALVAVEAGADAVGFVFYAKSPRNVSVEAAREICSRLPESVEKVGVFVDADAGRIREIAQEAGLSAVQLHGDVSCESVLGDARPPMECVGVSKVIVMVSSEVLVQDTGVMIKRRLTEKAFAVLVDSQFEGAPGGTGKQFDWDKARPVAHWLSLHIPVIVAGGLNASGVSEAIRIFQPFGVDVVSGVEAQPGKKDPAKVRAFVLAVREADRRAV